MRDLITQYPDARFRSRGSAFETLLRAIVGQQISVKAAQSVWDKFACAVSDISPKIVLATQAQTLRACGLSGQKVTYIRDLAEHFESGRLKPRAFHSKSDQELIELLCDVRGIGPWTAEMFLIFHLNRPDVYPLQDIGLIRAIEKSYRGGASISKKELLAIGEQWKPWRTVATWYLWRSLDPIPVEY
jgi:DNA-3-methyladenine glycosylase II